MTADRDKDVEKAVELSMSWSRDQVLMALSILVIYAEVAITFLRLGVGHEMGRGQ